MNTSNCNLSKLFTAEVDILTFWLCSAQVVFNVVYPPTTSISVEQKLKFNSIISNFKKKNKPLQSHLWSNEQIKIILLYALLFHGDNDDVKKLGFALYRYFDFKKWYSSKKFKSLTDAQVELINLLIIKSSYNENH